MLDEDNPNHGISTIANRHPTTSNTVRATQFSIQVTEDVVSPSAAGSDPSSTGRVTVYRSGSPRSILLEAHNCLPLYLTGDLVQSLTPPLTSVP